LCAAARRAGAPTTPAGGVDTFDDDPLVDRAGQHPVELGVQRVVLEATSEYWKPVFYLLEAHGLEPWLVNARDVKHLPGRPKTDL
jgi:transposase